MLIVLRNLPDILEVRDLQSVLKIGRNTAYKLLRDEVIYSFKIGNVYKIPKSSVQEYIKEQGKE